jgi:hypothetical protein
MPKSSHSNSVRSNRKIIMSPPPNRYATHYSKESEFEILHDLTFFGNKAVIEKLTLVNS